jgi:hypothetical protein
MLENSNGDSGFRFALCYHRFENRRHCSKSESEISGNPQLESFSRRRGESVVRHEFRRKQDESYVYMVSLTSKESKEGTVTGLESGAADYLAKPFNADKLKARLRTGERILCLEGRLVETRK